MTQPILRTVSVFDAAHSLVKQLERHRAIMPFAEEELASHTLLRLSLEEHQRRSEEALCNWRSALARRWDCEIVAQRTYTNVQRQLGSFYGPGSAYLQMVAPAHAGSALTPTDLLLDLRRLEASLGLLSPEPPFARTYLMELANVICQLDAAISETIRYEAERRSVQLDHRLAIKIYQRACKRIEQLLGDFEKDHGTC